MSLAETTLINAGLQAGLFDNELLNRLRPQARLARQSLLDALARELGLPHTAFVMALARVRGLPFCRPGQWHTDEDALARLPAPLLRRHPMAPMRGPADPTLHLAVGDPDDAMGIEAARRVVGALPLALAEADALAVLVRRLRGGEVGRSSGDLDPVALFDQVIREARLLRASDIHVESLPDGVRIRLRVDGRMQEFGGLLPRDLGEGLISRLKVLGGMDIAESRAPQDGGIAYTLADNETVEMRVASAPTKFGERLTLRIMKSDPGRLSLDALGMPAEMSARLREALAHPHGIVLVTGPTGSGKSTTLYAALRELDASSLNILTAEDPVEQVIPGISQLPVSGKVGFADALRSFLRHDPDVILVGEIRDLDTADVALKAATTGHMVLATLHTNSAAGAVTRLADIGCEPFLLGATLRAVIAQRLVRQLCRHCKTLRPATPEELHLLGQDGATPLELAFPAGCPHCLGCGYRGRVGLFEALWVDGDLAEAIADGARERDIARRAAHLWRLADDARAKVLSGTTSLTEVRPYLAGAD